MKKKYNLALMPLSKSREIINLSAKFSHIADQYLLGAQSLPHMTLYQFYFMENDIDQLWKNISLIWEKKSTEFSLEKFSCITSDDIFWVSLIPNKRELLFDMHAIIADILQLPIKKTFDPHVTLCNTKNKEYEKEVAKVATTYNTITDKFILGLGESDEIGQFIRLINRIDII